LTNKFKEGGGQSRCSGETKRNGEHAVLMGEGEENWQRHGGTLDRKSPRIGLFQKEEGGNHLSWQLHYGGKLKGGNFYWGERGGTNARYGLKKGLTLCRISKRKKGEAAAELTRLR